MNATRMIRLGGVQGESRNFDAERNLCGAELVLCPEFLATGYLYDRPIWNVAEPRGGPTERWLSRMAQQHSLYIGASYLEASSDNFFNTFALMNPHGAVAGRVRKESLPG